MQFSCCSLLHLFWSFASKQIKKNWNEMHCTFSIVSNVNCAEFGKALILCSDIHMVWFICCGVFFLFLRCFRLYHSNWKYVNNEALYAAPTNTHLPIKNYHQQNAQINSTFRRTKLFEFERWMMNSATKGHIFACNVQTIEIKTTIHSIINSIWWANNNTFI